MCGIAEARANPTVTISRIGYPLRIFTPTSFHKICCRVWRVRCFCHHIYAQIFSSSRLLTSGRITTITGTTLRQDNKLLVLRMTNSDGLSAIKSTNGNCRSSAFGKSPFHPSLTTSQWQPSARKPEVGEHLWR